MAGAEVAGVAAELAAAAVTEVVAVTSPALAPYTADGWVHAHAALVAEVKPTWVVLPHTYQTRDFAPALAASLDRALVTDCTAIKQVQAPGRVSRGRCTRASWRPTCVCSATRRGW